MFAATVIDGDIHQQARARVAISVGILMGCKNVPRNICNCEAMAAAIVARLDMRQLFTIVHGTPDDDTCQFIDQTANHWLDHDAAIHMIEIFARVGGIGEIPEHVFNGLLERTLARLKCSNPFSDEFLIWPASEAIEEMAVTNIGPARPVDLNMIELALRPVFASQFPESRVAKTRWRAWRAVTAEIADLMERKNVRPGVITSEGIAALIVEGMSDEQHTRIANGTPDDECRLRINAVAENEIDFSAASVAIDIFARAGGLGDLPDIDVIEMAGRIVDYRRGNRQSDDETLVWPSPLAVELLASRCFRERSPRDLAAFEAAIFPLMTEAQP